MSETPKFEVIDRRRHKAEQEEREAASAPAETPAKPAENATTTAEQKPAEEKSSGPWLVGSEESSAGGEEGSLESALPPEPTAEEKREQKLAYDASSQRLEDLVRAQNPAAGPQPTVTFEHLVQQFYLSAMLQMGAATQEGQRPRVDILGAKQTIDLLGVLAEKTQGNLTPTEDRMLQAVLFEARMAFLELTNMIALQGVGAPPPPPVPGKR